MGQLTFLILMGRIVKTLDILTKFHIAITALKKYPQPSHIEPFQEKDRKRQSHFLSRQFISEKMINSKVLKKIRLQAFILSASKYLNFVLYHIMISKNY